ncbi:hypothetical protein K438DRAFT_1748054 [Mycena galopus ATCC 62051]|nr:hypothetical protein K438DRAFT_1748054 [Mycena galopus ATCC 62051]
MLGVVYVERQEISVGRGQGGACIKFPQSGAGRVTQEFSVEWAGGRARKHFPQSGAGQDTRIFRGTGWGQGLQPFSASGVGVAGAGVHKVGRRASGRGGSSISAQHDCPPFVASGPACRITSARQVTPHIRKYGEKLNTQSQKNNCFYQNPAKISKNGLFLRTISQLAPYLYGIPIWEPCHEGLGQSVAMNCTIALLIFDEIFTHCLVGFDHILTTFKYDLLGHFLLRG